MDRHPKSTCSYIGLNEFRLFDPNPPAPPLAKGGFGGIFRRVTGEGVTTEGPRDFVEHGTV